MAESHDDITCQEVVELITDYLEGTLPADEAARFEQHIASCDGCARYLEQMRTTIAATGRIGEPDVPPAMRDRLLAAFRQRGRS